MKKFIIITLVAAVLGGVYTFAQNAVATTATTTLATSSPQVIAFVNQLQILRQLRQGMSGDDVKVLQALLAADSSIYPEGLITGYFGNATAKAVKRFQKNHNFEQVGSVGPKTRGELNKLLKDDSSVAFENDNEDNATSTNRRNENGDNNQRKRICAIVPPGHLIAPGWLRKQGGDDKKPIVPPCQILPPGIDKKLGSYATSTSTTTPPVVDITAPVISALVATTTTATASQITWSTNESATTKLIYGTSSPVLASSAATTPVVVSGLSLNHLVNLSSLTASTTYYFVAVSADVKGNTATSSQGSFITLGL